jgi:cobalt-zinc-cadmium resistance protein CzcA
VEQEAQNYRIRLSSQAKQLTSTLNKYQKAINYYEGEGKALAAELVSHASLAFQNGEIDFLQLVQLLENAKNIELSYLENLQAYNQTVLDFNYLMINEQQ